MAGVTMIEVFEHVSISAIIGVVCGAGFFVLAITGLMIACESEDKSSFIVAGLCALISVLFMVVSIPGVHQRGFRARVDNITAWAEISTHYVMTDLDPNGVFTFKER